MPHNFSATLRSSATVAEERQGKKENTIQCYLLNWHQVPEDPMILGPSQLRNSASMEASPVPQQRPTRRSIYRKLNPRTRQIRLLSLHKSGNDVQWSLSTSYLRNKPRFTTLSYLWGDPNITVPIIVNETEIQVRTNLI